MRDVDGGEAGDVLGGLPQIVEPLPSGYTRELLEDGAEVSEE